MKTTSRFPYALLMLGIITTLVATALTPSFTALAEGGVSPASGGSVPQPIEPLNVITDFTPTYRWTQVAGASSYQLQVLKEYGTTIVYTFTVPSSGSCYSNVCSFTTTQRLDRFGYRWKVKVSNAATWSPLMTFYIRGNSFANHFTYGLMYWWSRKSGGEWHAQYDGGVQGYLVSEGLPDRCSAAIHHTSSTYDNFVAETKMKITGVPSAGKYPEAYLALRMKNNVNSATQCWYGGYLFGYSRDGKYSFWKMTNNGTWVAIIPPTFSSAIKVNDWNNFKVTASGSRFYLKINKTDIGYVTDNSYNIGYIGFEMVNHGSVPTKFYADWITVDMLP